MKKNNNKEKLEIVFLLLLLFILALIVGINRIKNSDFSPTNGDFQNYNPVNRLLNGQIPYKDFAVYLGTGHLFLISVALMFIGNTFTKSLFVTNVLTFLCFELFSFVMSFLILKDKKKSLYLTLVLSLLNLCRPVLLKIILDPQILASLDVGIAPGLSARAIRMAVIPAYIFLMYIGLKLLKKSKNTFIQKHLLFLQKLFIASIAGISILWSNDGGISTYISISFVYFLGLLKKYKTNILSIIKNTFLYICLSFMSFLIVITIITLGHPLAWIKFTLGVSSYQSWYYLNAVDKQNVNLTQINSELLVAVMIFFAVFYMVKFIKEKKSKKNELFFALLSTFYLAIIVSMYLYQIGSGGIYKDFLGLGLLVTIMALIYKYIKLENVKINSLIKVVIFLFAFNTIGLNVRNEIKSFKNRDENKYVEELGGYLSNGDTINYVIDRLKDEKIFSVYASAINAATHQFQPTGIDYIIHALGDKQREEYMNVFRTGDFKYVEDLDTSYSLYNWISFANWFFYREMYKN